VNDWVHTVVDRNRAPKNLHSYPLPSINICVFRTLTRCLIPNPIHPSTDHHRPPADLDWKVSKLQGDGSPPRIFLLWQGGEGAERGSQTPHPPPHTSPSAGACPRRCGPPARASQCTPTPATGPSAGASALTATVRPHSPARTPTVRLER